LKGELAAQGALGLSFWSRRDIKIVPILVGALSHADEVLFGQLLAPYLEQQENLFVISSDFCHW
jgi:AmmeMemoRadiSam system protein B